MHHPGKPTLPLSVNNQIEGNNVDNLTVDFFLTQTGPNGTQTTLRRRMRSRLSSVPTKCSFDREVRPSQRREFIDDHFTLCAWTQHTRKITPSPTRAKGKQNAIDKLMILELTALCGAPFFVPFLSEVLGTHGRTGHRELFVWATKRNERKHRTKSVHQPRRWMRAARLIASV